MKVSSIVSKAVCIFMLLTIALVLASCSKVENPMQLSAPTNVRVDNGILKWNPVEQAVGYTVEIRKDNGNETGSDGEEIMANSNEYSLLSLTSGNYLIRVKARGDSILYLTSPYSEYVFYTRNTDSGEKYEDNVSGAFGSFDEINTKNSFLGYGIDIINASAITSKNVLMTYPIFDMKKLQSETLLKSNEHYNSFISIEAESIEEFCKSIGNSTSITSGASAYAKGNISGVDVGGSVSFSQGLTTNFTKTNSNVESQYFLEVISENQSYWLILQTSEERYKDILSESFKEDLYNTNVTPAMLFDKYGTHLLTSVAMGGNICMYYTMYSYSEEDLSSKYAEISSTVKANVEASYGGASAGVGTEGGFSTAYTYQTLAAQYGIQIDKKIISAGGGSFGINNEATLYQNYYDWQKSLDTYPVLIGVKDTNSLYPIWELLDLDVDGATDRYNELYAYFCEYGEGSYNELCEMYSIAPKVSPTDITNIKIGQTEDYEEGQVIQVKSGETMRITFDVLPDNASKFTKVFASSNPEIVSIDSTGAVVVAGNASAGKHVTITISAGTISKQITLYVINSFNVTFNTGYNDVVVPPIKGVFEGYSITEPQIFKEGYSLVGWYRDLNWTEKFDFDEDRVTSHLTLYAKWAAIKPKVVFETGDGSTVVSQTLAYKGNVVKPDTPVLSGYTFDGWFEDEEYTRPFDFNTALTKDITLFAKWVEIKYQVNFVTNGGTPIASVTTSITNGYKIEEPKNVNREFYKLEGWYKNASLTQKFYFESEVTSDLTLYAKWAPIPVTITFVDSDGVSSVYDEQGSIIDSFTTDINKSFKISSPDAYKEGYTFKGWFLNGKKIDISVYDDFKPNENGYILSAKWDINSYTVTYKINGELYATENYVFGEEIVDLDVDVDGYTFRGWKYGIKEIPDSMPAMNLTLDGILVAKSYSIEYYVDGSLYEKITLDFGEDIDLIAEPSASGKKFSGWIYSSGGIVPTTMPSHNIRFDGAFDQVLYTVRYYIDDELIHSVDVNKGFGISAYIPYNKEGYSFSGWKQQNGSAAPSVMPAGDLNLYGSYSINQYTITFDTNGGSVVSSITADYGSVITKPANPTKVGYTFSGWNQSIPNKMPAENITVAANWTINKYTITFETNGGSVVSSITADYGSVITKPANPTKDGYSFDGWNRNIPTTMPAEDITIKANWVIHSGTIVFDTLGGSTVDSIGSVSHEDVVILPEAPTKGGYEFKGWIIDGNNNIIYSSGDSYNIVGKVQNFIITVTPLWKLYEPSINYVANNKVTVDGQETKGGFKVNGSIEKVSNNVTVLNIANSDKYALYYDFVGWTDGSGVYITGSDGILLRDVPGYTDESGKWIRNGNETVDLYAQWKQVYDGIYICDEDELRNIEENEDYHIIDDIRLTAAWNPIPAFSGTIDGHDNIIFDLDITSSNSKIGFILVCSGTLSNISFSSTRITGVAKGNNIYAGTIVSVLTSNGAIYGCKIDNCTIDARAYDYNDTEDSCRYAIVGGIVGQSSGTIEGCEVANLSIYAFSKKHDKGYCTGWGEAALIYVGGVAGEASSGSINNNNVKSLIKLEGGAEYRENYWFPFQDSSSCSRICLGGVIGCQTGSSLTQFGNICNLSTDNFKSSFNSYNGMDAVSPVEDTRKGNIIGYKAS